MGKLLHGICQSELSGGICQREMSGGIIKGDCQVVCGICHQGDGQVVSVEGIGMCQGDCWVASVKGDYWVAYVKGDCAGGMCQRGLCRWHLSKWTIWVAYIKGDCVGGICQTGLCGWHLSNGTVWVASVKRDCWVAYVKGHCQVVCGMCHQRDGQVVSFGGVGLVTCDKGDRQVAYAKWHLSRETDYPVACFNQRDLLSSNPPCHDTAS